MNINDSLRLETITLADFPASAAIGTAAATVDIASSFNIPQTTLNVVITIPNPTPVRAGRRITINNTGTVDVHVGNAFVQSGTSVDLNFNGSAWIKVGVRDKCYVMSGYTAPSSSATFNPNSGLNTVVNGVSTMPASTIVYGIADGNFVNPISLPSAVGRTGGLSFYSSASFNSRIVTTNTDLDQDLFISTNTSVHFVASGGRWRWVETPQLYAPALINDQSATGYVDIGNTRMQWGSSTTNGGTRTITLPAAFLNATYTVTSTINGTFGTANTLVMAIAGKTTTNFTTQTQQLNTNNSTIIAASGQSFNWIALGRKP